MQESLFYEMFKRAERFSLEDFTDEEVQEEGIEVPELTEEEFAQEGIGKAILGDMRSDFSNASSEMKGWSLDIGAKRKHVKEKCLEAIDWLKEQDKDNPGLKLDMGGFKTWLKTSETFIWRYYFLLNDGVYNGIIKSIKNNEISEIEAMVDFSISDRKKAARMIDSAMTIKDLIVIVERYRSRADMVFDGLMKRKRKIQSVPYQIILLGAHDLIKTVKKVVNLAT